MAVCIHKARAKGALQHGFPLLAQARTQNGAVIGQLHEAILQGKGRCQGIDPGGVTFHLCGI